MSLSGSEAKQHHITMSMFDCKHDVLRSEMLLKFYPILDRLHIKNVSPLSLQYTDYHPLSLGDL